MGIRASGSGARIILKNCNNGQAGFRVWGLGRLG